MALPADLGHVFPFKEKVPSFRDIGTVRPSDLGLQPAFGKWRQPSSGALVAVSGLGGGRCRAVLPDYTCIQGGAEACVLRSVQRGWPLHRRGGAGAPPTRQLLPVSPFAVKPDAGSWVGPVGVSTSQTL